MTSYDDHFKRRCVGTEFKFILVPKKCHTTGKILWLEKAYKQTAMLTGPGDTIFEYRWYDKDIFLIEKIKGTV
jgi:hypothetical protein